MTAKIIYVYINRTESIELLFLKVSAIARYNDECAGLPYVINVH